ncbi:hypothetical protein CEXT_95911 [Caerostris extrusa]|uniref:Uncharacterized protein n=1 Tax=Caerostris extrusa TaxID=172846 RepID=A0AAV4XWV2_CAEEX|nr:hypothetical protein CEXT_95911 [Caerostris extrusa]
MCQKHSAHARSGFGTSHPTRRNYSSDFLIVGNAWHTVRGSNTLRQKADRFHRLAFQGHLIPALVFHSDPQEFRIDL